MYKVTEMKLVKFSNRRHFVVGFFIATSVMSGLLLTRVYAEGGDSDRKTFRIDAGFKVYESSTGFNFVPSNVPGIAQYACIPLDQVGAPYKSMSDCLRDASLTLRIRNNLGPCDAVVSIPCVEGVFMRNPSSNWSKGDYVGEQSFDFGIPKFGPIPQLEVGIQRGGSLYVFPGIDTDLSRLYVVYPTMERRVVNGKLLNPLSLNVSMRGIKKMVGKWKSDPSLYNSGADMTSAYIECNASNYSSECWQHTRNSSENQFKLVLRLPALPFGWLTGRLFQPNIEFESVQDATGQPYRVTLTGNPIPTPRITRYYYSNVPAEYDACRLLDNFIRATTYSSNNCFPVSPFPGNPTLEHSIKSDGNQSYLDLVGIDPEFNVATDIVDDWQVAMNFDEGLSQNNYGLCEKQGLFNGFVSSNALTYSAKPIFDSKLSSLNYVVAGPHFIPDKSVFNGLYSMIITKDYAKCIWGLSNSVFKASLEVIDQDGATSNVVTIIGTDDKYVRLSATGFTFSQKTLKVKFFNTAKALNDSKKKITCVKGKTVRTITGVKPVCPKGFKVKN
jgi:hypothetical protein